MAPGIAGIAVGTVTSVYFWVYFAQNARDPRSDYKQNAILYGVTAWGQLAVGAPLLFRGLLGEDYSAPPSLPYGEAPEIRRVPRGAYLASGILTTLVGVALLGAAIPYERDVLRYPPPTYGLILNDYSIGDFFYGALMAAGAGHVAVGIPLIVRGAVGETVAIPPNHWTKMFGMTIQPFAGMNHAGIRGEF